jgi:hypothetical protein
MNCEDGICQFLSALGFELLRAPSLPPSLASFPQQNMHCRDWPWMQRDVKGD